MKRHSGVQFRASLITSLLACVLTLGLSAPARAQEAERVGATVARANVRVRLVGVLGGDRVLKQRIASWFEPARFAVSVESVSYLEPQQVLSPGHGLQVEAWVTRRSDKLARLYFASPDPDTGKTRYLLRDLGLESGFDEMGAESLAEAVHLSSVALLDGQLTSSREQVEQSLQTEAAATRAASPTENTLATNKAGPTPSPVATVRPADSAASSAGAARVARPPELAMALGYAAQLRGDEGLAHGPRARLRVALPARWGVLGRMQFVLPHRRELSDLSLELYGGAALLAASFRARLSPHFVVEGFVGPSLELVRYVARARDGVDFTPAPAATELRPQLVFGALFGIGKAPCVALIPEVALALHATHYEMARAGRRENVASAAWLTPGLAVELEL